MILVYFVANAGGYQARSMRFMGTDSLPSDLPLKSNLRTPSDALRYARNWIRHTGSKIDADSYIVASRCFCQDIPCALAAQVLIEAKKDDSIFQVHEGRPQIDYSIYMNTLLRLLPEFGKEMNGLIEVLNAKGRNYWLVDLLDQMTAYYNKREVGHEFREAWICS